MSTGLWLMEGEGSIGRITKESIDRIKEYPEVNEVAISGLTQETFDYFVTTYGGQFETILFWKCPLVEDLRTLEFLMELKYLVYFWNQRAVRLWDFSKTAGLKGFAYDDFTRMHDISQIASTHSLEELHLGNRIWTKYVIESLKPLEHMHTIRHLSMSAKKIIDQRIEPIAGLVNLESLDFPSNLFATEQVAWLKAHLSTAVQSERLHAYWQIGNPITMGKKNKDTFIVGKGKPFLDSKLEKDRIDKYVHQFNAMYHWYVANPEAKPEEYRA
jgi:hypothetical protein